MVENDIKEVYFGLYCKTCQHYVIPADRYPCSDCINKPLNDMSRKPDKYESGK